MISLPGGWVEEWITKWEYPGVFALCWYKTQRIAYWSAWWLYPFRYFVVKHERAHAWGIPNCISKDKKCVMYEDDDTWVGKLKLLPYQIVGLGRYCADCRHYLEGKGAL